MLQTYDQSEIEYIDSLFALTEEEMRLREKAEGSLREFMRQAWDTVEKKDRFTDGWHIGAICEHLEAVYLGQIRKLLINVPPRTTKSTMVSVMFLPWVWTKNPAYRFLYASYSSRIAKNDSRRCRHVIGSDWYQRRWGDQFRIDSKADSVETFINDQTGFRKCFGIEGSVTGDGADIRTVDDGNNVKDGESEARRLRANDFLTGTWATRSNDPKQGAKILLQQRVHYEDMTGTILSSEEAEDYVKLILPMEYETDRKCRTIILPSTKGKAWEDPRKEEGDLLWPERFDKESLIELKREMGNNQYKIAGQLQQRPAPAEGGLIRKNWFPLWKSPRPPKFTQIIQSWDTALKAGEKNCYSACTTYGVFKDPETDMNNLVLLAMWRGKVDYPELLETAQKLYEDYRWTEQREDEGLHQPDGKHIPNIVLIEDMSSGSTLIQSFRKAGVLATRFDPKKYGDKMERVHLATPMLEAGMVWVPARPPDYTKRRSWAEDFVNECALFPNASSRDIVDTLTQVILRLEANKVINNPNNKVIYKDNMHKPTKQGKIY